MAQSNFIFDWNLVKQKKNNLYKPIEICDETLRDGIQSPSVHDPDIESKLKLIDLMEQLNITIADIGLPGAGNRAYSDVLHIAKYMAHKKYKLKASCAARTLESDIAPIADIQQKSGLNITAYCFLGTSPIRQLVEGWSLDRLRHTVEKAINFARKEHLEVAFVTEDTIRSSPETLRVLFNDAIELGVSRLVLCDTVGHATPSGISSLVNFTKEIIGASDKDIGLDWHGHNDRGLGVSNAIYAAECGCDRIHGTALGVGERVGNTAIDQLIVNLKLLGAYPYDVNFMSQYVELASKFCNVPISFNYPVFGRDAFRTATGVHAAAIIKAKSEDALADAVYSAVPANWFGMKQIIEIGPMSGSSNIRFWLKENGVEYDERLVGDLLSFAKCSPKILTDEEISKFIADNKA